MLNVFQLAENDQSLMYLGQIFGNVGVALAGTGPALIPMMFKVFNTTMLVIGCLIVAYITVMGVMNTAQEGEFLGKKWNKLWTPIRTILGIVLLFPTKAGYCIMQVIVMWVVVQGVGAADMVWKTAVDYFAAGGAQVNPTPTDFGNLAPDIVKTVFAGTVCQSALVKKNAADKKAVAHSIPIKAGDTLIGYKFGLPKSDTNAEILCGGITWDKVTTPGMPDAIASTMQTLVPVIETLANEYVVKVIETDKCWSTCPVDPKTGKKDNAKCFFENQYPSDCIVSDASAGYKMMSEYGGSNFVRDATLLIVGYANNYTTIAAQEALKSSGNTNITETPDLALRRAQANGWIFAGAFYYYLAGQTGSKAQDFNDFLKAIDRTSIVADTSKFENAAPFYTGAKNVVDTATAAAASAADQAGGISLAGRPSTGSTGGVGGGSMGKVANFGSEMVRLFVSDLTNTNQNPILGIAAYGKGCLIAAEVLWFVFVVASIAIAGAGQEVLVWGYTVSFWANIMRHIGFLLIVTVTFIFGFLFVVGALLGIYVPLIPYIVFTFGAIGWMILVIEAMMAGPIIALGVLSPGGQHELLGKAEPAAGMLLNIFLRPTLMIFGMMAAMLLSWVIIRFINAGFLPVVASIGGGSILSGFLFIMAYAGLVITALNKCFALIHILPDKTLSWIGVRGESQGEEQSLGAVKGDVTAGGGVAKTSGAAQAGRATPKMKSKEDDLGATAATPPGGAPPKSGTPPPE